MPAVAPHGAIIGSRPLAEGRDLQDRTVFLAVLWVRHLHGVGTLSRLRSWAADSDTVRRWREARYQLFIDACAVEPGDRIIDVGAGGAPCSSASIRRTRSSPSI